MKEARSFQLAERNLGLEQRFEVLLRQPRLDGAGLLVAAEKTRKPLGAVAVASPCGLELVVEDVFGCWRR